MHARVRISLTSLALAVVSLAAASSATASVTIGQLSPITPAAANCSSGAEEDLLQPTVVGGNSYVVPPGGKTITSWSTIADSNADQHLTMKVYREVSNGPPPVYMAVGHDGPRLLAPGVLNAFTTSIPVEPGDVLGLNDDDASTHPNACLFAAVGETYLIENVDLVDGTSSPFTASAGFRANVQAAVDVIAPPPVVTLPAATAPTGQRAAALKKCKKKKSKKARKKCKKKANLLPV